MITQHGTATLLLTRERADAYSKEYDPDCEDFVDANVEAEIEHDTISDCYQIIRLYEILPDGRPVEIDPDELVRFDYEDLVSKAMNSK